MTDYLKNLALIIILCVLSIAWGHRPAHASMIASASLQQQLVFNLALVRKQVTDDDYDCGD